MKILLYSGSTLHSLGIPANLPPDHVYDHGADQGVLDDKGIQVRGRIGDNRSHDVHAATVGSVDRRVRGDRGVSGDRCQGSRDDAVETLHRCLGGVLAGDCLVQVVQDRSYSGCDFGSG